MIADDTFYLKINQAFFKEKFAGLVAMAEEKYPDSLKIEKKYA